MRIGELGWRIRELVWRILEGAREFIREKAPEFLQARRRRVLLSLGAAVLALILVFTAVVLGQNHIRAVRSRAAAGELSDSFRSLTIAPGDLFLPGEPDVLPEFIPERPPRDTWTEADAGPYWTDPLEGKEQVWRDRLGAVIDDLMEGVP
jgi:hypothetical protein